MGEKFARQVYGEATDHINTEGIESPMGKKSNRQSDHHGEAGFHLFYQQVYGERWERLKAALVDEPRQVARLNRFSNQKWMSPAISNEDILKIGESIAISRECEKLGSGPSWVDVGLEGLEGSKNQPGQVLNYYVMDAASIYAAEALRVSSGDRVLDLCAAPGGKSLILIEKLGEAGFLVANELSDRRRARLRSVFDAYLPNSTREKNLKVTHHDGSKWCLYEQEAYDRVLLDAPCSGERHLMGNPKELNQWSKARSKNLSVRQFSLLASAFGVVKKNGRIVYSTCSISPTENDDVIAKLLKKRKGKVRVVEQKLDIGEATEFGWILLPDTTGFGPIYFSVLEKAESDFTSLF